MELKDVILSTLAEMEENISDKVPPSSKDYEVKEISSVQTKTQNEDFFPSDDSEAKNILQELQSSNTDNEMMFLNSIRERLLVLFEGFQAPNNANIEAKVDLTLNFLEYVLATIDSRVEKLEKGKKQ
ncbi:hypothetical protein KJ877_10435 [bacterium]|nr:hypothetical protein [bacterium]MBU1991091.1 hypothetical protein [bacterium]